MVKKAEIGDFCKVDRKAFGIFGGSLKVTLHH